MQEVPWMDLVPGRRYRIERIEGGITQPLLGTFTGRTGVGYHYIIANDGAQMRVPFINSIFNNLVYSNGRREQPNTTSSFTSFEWVFFESGEEIMSEQVARGLSNRIPENAAGIIQRMIIGNKPAGRGPNRYPARTRKNRKKRKSRR
jgi:hypothetical protein